MKLLLFDEVASGIEVVLEYWKLLLYRRIWMIQENSLL